MKRAASDAEGRDLRAFPQAWHIRRTMAQADTDGAPTDVRAAEIDHAAERLRAGEVVRVALPGRGVALCTTLDDVKTAQRGKIPARAVRLDRGAAR